jgi:ABC-type nickel/cobalt efflux system permease component RcnA
MSLIATLLYGFWIGLKHAFDADHIIAVSTIVSEHRSIFRSSLVGAFWGLGHTASLLIVGLAVMLMRVSIPPGAAPWMEAPVGIMLILLGAMSLRRALGGRAPKIHSHVHSHGDQPPHEHLHFHGPADHDHKHYALRIGGKPFIVGMVHGMAGSAALMLLVLSTIESALLGLIYIALFGLGSIGGMLLISALISLPFRAVRVGAAVQLIAGFLSVAFGFWIIFELATN